MNRIYIFSVAVILLSLSVKNTAKAQIWADIAPLLEQLDTDTRNDFLDNLDELTETFDYNSIQLGGVIDSLMNNLDVLNVNGPIDSLFNAWGTNRDSLIQGLGNSGFGPLDSLLIINEYDRINELWFNNLDSINIILNDYQDTTSTFDPNLMNEANLRFEVFEGLWTQIFGDLRNLLEDGFDNTDPDGLGGFGPALDKLFSSMFDLGLAFGQEFSDAKFYGKEYSLTATSVRVGSVPRFDSDFEARWHVQGSFFNADESIVSETNFTIQPGFNNFLCSGEFAIMYNPLISERPGTQFRLYSSLGLEIGTYAPSHRIEADPIKTNRVGNTTGFGPQMGAGMIVNTGDISFYTFGTVTLGTIVDENSFWANNGYDYNATSLNAGLRYGSAVNILYTMGTGQWAPNEGKLVSYNRISLGIILNSLNRPSIP